MIEQFKRTNRASKLRIAAVALILATTSVAAPGAPVSASCAASKVKVISHSTPRSTSSITYSALAGTTINFYQGGSSSSCVIVDLSLDARLAAPSARFIFLSALMDGTTSALFERAFSLESAGFEPKSVTFVFPSVAPGNHQIRIQFHSSADGIEVIVANTNVVVHMVP